MCSTRLNSAVSTSPSPSPVEVPAALGHTVRTGMPCSSLATNNLLDHSSAPLCGSLGTAARFFTPHLVLVALCVQFGACALAVHPGTTCRYPPLLSLNLSAGGILKWALLIFSVAGATLARAHAARKNSKNIIEGCFFNCLNKGSPPCCNCF